MGHKEPVLWERAEEVHEEPFRRARFKTEIPMTTEMSLHGLSLSRYFQVTFNNIE